MYPIVSNRGCRTRSICDSRTNGAPSYVCFPRFLGVRSARASYKNERSVGGKRCWDTDSYSGGTVAGHKMHVNTAVARMAWYPVNIRVLRY